MNDDDDDDDDDDDGLSRVSTVKNTSIFLYGIKQSIRG